jgi:hypothetical protein
VRTVRIESDGTGRGTTIRDEESGIEIPASSLTIRISAIDVNYASIVVPLVKVDTILDAEIQAECPACGWHVDVDDA